MDRPTIAQRLRRDGPPAVPRPSASVIVVRAAGAGVELLLVRRNPQQRFMGGFWVFPGGAVDAGESHRAAAVRELAEEAQIGVDPGDLAEYSRWITPEAIEVRFDTHFFLARLPAGARARVDGQECVDLRWVTPRDALDACSRGDLALVFPTIKLLEGLSAFASVDELFAHARDIVVAPVLPRVVAGADAPRVLLPGEPGYDDEEAV
jgi:8-oxo-dGTP pyrophosphatase MutT (NUDIX family)